MELSKNIEQNTEGFLLVKSYNRQKEQTEKFKEINSQMYNADYKIGVAKNKISSVINLLWAYCYVAGFGIGIIYILEGTVTVGGIVAFIGYIGQILGNFVSAIQSFLQKMPYFSQSINRFNYFLNLEEFSKQGKKLEKIDKIEIKHLSYWYNDDKKPSLNDINMIIKKGEKIGIIGEVGSGKTTLMNIICGFYEIPNETIYINDQDINIYQRNTISALDTKTEKKIMDTLIKEVSNNTLIVISNKISNVKQLDKIYIVLNGQIQDFGTHEELKQRNEFYKELDYLERKEEIDEIYSKEKY